MDDGRSVKIAIPRNLRSSFSVAHHAREWHYITGA